MNSDNTNGRTFKPTIIERQILAGGMRIAEVDDEGRVIFEDRYRRRCLARGTDDVPVDVLELLEALLVHYREGAG
jgi:hypothetical protein